MSKRRTVIQESSKNEKRDTHLKTAFKKTSGILAILLVISVIAPMMAFANFGTVNYQNDTISGEVYYASPISLGAGESVYITATLEGGVTKLVYAEQDYSKTTNGMTYYKFNSTIGTATYAILSDTYGSVAQKVYAKASGGTVPVNTTPGTVVPADGTISADQLANLIKGNPNATISLSGEFVKLPVSAFAGGVTLTIIGVDGNAYVLPIGQLNLDAIAKELGVETKDLVIKVAIKKLAGDDAKKVTDAVASAGGTQIASSIDFIVSAIGKDGKESAVSRANLGNSYIKRVLKLTKSAVDNSKTTGVMYDPTTGKVSFVPTTFTTTNNVTDANIFRNGNSIYTVVETNKASLADTADHWAKADIDLLTNKLVVEGTSATTFEPQRNITRAEFAALVVRSLGLTTGDKTASTYKDVAADAWYTEVVNAAAAANLIEGYEDGSFRPNNNITREELSALVVRALKYAGQNVTVSASEQATLLAKFTDASAIKWGQNEVAVAVKAGIVNGQTDTTLATNSNATRAESATMLKRFLSNAKFID